MRIEKKSADGCKRDKWPSGSSVSSTRNGLRLLRNEKKEVEEENYFSVSQTSYQTNVLLKHQIISSWIFSPQDLLWGLVKSVEDVLRVQCGEGAASLWLSLPTRRSKTSHQIDGWTVEAGPNRAIWHTGAPRPRGEKSVVSFWEGLGRISWISS